MTADPPYDGEPWAEITLEELSAAWEMEACQAEVTRLRAAILDIDAHATPLSEDADGGVTGGYLISVGALHRAIGVVGHTSPPCRICKPSSTECEKARIEADAANDLLHRALMRIAAWCGIEADEDTANYQLLDAIGARLTNGEVTDVGIRWVS